MPTTLDDPGALQVELADCGDLVEVFAADDRLGDETDCVRDGLTNDLAAETIVADLTAAARAPSCPGPRRHLVVHPGRHDPRRRDPVP